MPASTAALIVAIASSRVVGPHTPPRPPPPSVKRLTSPIEPSVTLFISGCSSAASITEIVHHRARARSTADDRTAGGHERQELLDREVGPFEVGGDDEVESSSDVNSNRLGRPPPAFANTISTRPCSC